MIKVENLEAYGWEAAIRGMRNPLNSWTKSDSYWTKIEDPETLQTANFEFFVGENDLDLMKRLFKGGTEHRKYLRQICVSMDITAPFYWWKEFDTYKVGTTANSCSTMHTIHKKPFEIGDFSHEHLFVGWDFENPEKDLVPYNNEYYDTSVEVLEHVVNALNKFRERYIETKDKSYWWQMIQLLPSSYNQKRTITMNYEVVFNILRQRSDHKLDEWREFCSILRTLPYVAELEGVIRED